MKHTKYCLLFVLLAGLLFLAACGKPQDFAEADTRRLLAQPTATAAAIRNQEAQIRVTLVAAAQAQADAKSILARTDQQIAEDAHQESMRHQGEMNALVLSNTLQLNEINERYTTAITAIRVNGEEAVANAQAAMEERMAQARIATGVSYGLVIFILIVCVGIGTALYRRSNNAAEVRVLADDGRNQTIAIGTRIVHRTQQQIGPYVVYDEPSRLERLIVTLTTALIAIRQRNSDVLTQPNINRRTTVQTTDALPADLVKLDNNAVAGWVAGQAVSASPEAAQQITASVVQRATRSFEPEDDVPELVLLNDPVQRQHLEEVVEQAR